MRVGIWTEEPGEQKAARAAGLDARHAPLWIDLEGRDAELAAPNGTLKVMTANRPAGLRPESGRSA